MLVSLNVIFVLPCLGVKIMDCGLVNPAFNRHLTFPVTTLGVPQQRKIIKNLEYRLPIAMFALTRGQDQVLGKPDRRVEPLMPISRGPFDVLSYIFEICGEKDYRATLKISVVSRHWREIVLATPRAWAFVDVEDCRHDELVRLYLERSSPRPLHISIPLNRDFGLFRDVTDRIRCLSIPGTHAESLGEATFPNVTRLTIAGRNADIQRFVIDFKRFPSLQHLVCEPSWMFWHSSTYLPPLQSLSYVMTGRLLLMCFLKACKDSLTSLKLIRPTHYPSIGVSCVLPRLQYLEIQNQRRQEGTFPLNIQTPVLETFVETEEGPSSNMHFHTDLENVRYMRTDRLPRLSILLKLRVLQLVGRPTVCEAVLDMLLEDFALCPELTLIDQFAGKVWKMKQKLAEVNKNRAIPIRLRSIIRAEDLPGVIPNSVRRLLFTLMLAHQF
jgi:hypothetical protein